MVWGHRNQCLLTPFTIYRATTQAPAPPAPQVDETLYADLNLTDHDYLYYYDDLLYGELSERHEISSVIRVYS